MWLEKITESDEFGRQPFVLLSTVVAPTFQERGKLLVIPIKNKSLPSYLAGITRNLCGHPLTVQVLKEIEPSLPEQEKAFWDGSCPALAVRPKGGVRGSKESGDTRVMIDDLEAAYVRWISLSSDDGLSVDTAWREYCYERNLTGRVAGYAYNSARYSAEDRDGNEVYAETIGD